MAKDCDCGYSNTSYVSLSNLCYYLQLSIKDRKSEPQDTIITMPENKTQNRDINFVSATTKSTSIASLTSSMKVSALPLLLCLLLLGISDVSVVVVTGFATTSCRTVGRETSLGLVSISQDVAAAPPSLFSSTATSQVHRTILRNAEENAIVADSRLGTALSSSASTTALLAAQSSETDGADSSIEIKTSTIGTNKRNFFASLDTMETLNGATKERSALLAKMIDEKKVIAVGETSKLAEISPSASIVVPTVSYEKPGSTETFLASRAASPVAEGSWKVVYAPHMTTAMDLFRGRFDVAYDLFSDSRIVSHAYYDFPVVGKGYLSVSGTYGSVPNDATNTYSRLNFDKAWIKALPSSSSTTTAAAKATPYDSLDAVPDSFLKTIINEIGKRAFIESVAVFPVSFLDDDTIVFEFEFLGTKICAHKV
jgi:hypothetical protein